MIPGFDEYPEAALSGDRIKILTVLRDRLADRVDSFPEEGSDRDFVTLTRELSTVTAELQTLGAADGLDELEQARAARDARVGSVAVDSSSERSKYRRRGA